MEGVRRRSPRSLVLAVVLLAAGATRAGASPYYNVTDVSSLTPAQYAALLPQTSEVPLTSAQRDALPTFSVLHYSTGQTTTESMKFLSYKGGDTVLGGIPSGYAMGWPITFGYTQIQPDGTFGPFIQITNNESENEYDLPWLNANNQILIGGLLHPRIYDLNTGTVTDFASILSPAIMQKYAKIDPISIADNGSILAQYGAGGNTPSGLIILSPQDVPLPAQQAPEPTALMTLLAGLAGLAVRRRWGRSG